MINTASQVRKALERLKNPKKAKISARFFKTGKGEYGEGDVFLGLIVPQMRKIAKKHERLSLKDLQELLNTQIHEYRFTALVILTNQYEKGNGRLKKEIARFYLNNAKKVNNWDLVDISAPKILGPYLLSKNRSILYKLARSKKLWERRIAIMSTFAFIREGEFDDTLKIAKMLLKDNHDLIHKAVGWMLREVGKKDQVVEERFLRKYCQHMPRTMLRYAIERFNPKKRRFYLGKS